MTKKLFKELSYPSDDGYLYIVADSHLDGDEAPYSEFCEMLDKLESPSILVCLGDLFKIWLAPRKFWSKGHEETMNGFRRLLDRGCKILFVVGNREQILPKKMNKKNQKVFPFTEVIWDACTIEWNNKKLGFMHGDTLNTKDRNYFALRTLVRSDFYRVLFKLIPGRLGKKIATWAESSAKKTNQKFRINFPEDEAINFTKQMLPGHDAFFIGHFHQEKELKIEGEAGYLKVVPDWLNDRVVLRIDKDLVLKTIPFEKV